MNLNFCTKKLEIVVFCMLLFAAAYFHQVVDYGNTRSRYFLVSAVVDYGTLNIDMYQELELDKSFSNGHYYSNKAIGASLLSIPVYWALRNLTPTGNGAPLSLAEKYFVKIFSTTLPFALLGVVLLRVAIQWGADIKTALWVVLAYSFGSIALLHATLFSGHQIAASFSFFSFAVLFKLKTETTRRLGAATNEQKNNDFHLLSKIFFAGLFAGLAALADYTAMFIAIALTGYALSLRLPWRLIVSFLLGGGLCIGVLAAYNLFCFGSVGSFSYSHLTHEAFQTGASKGLLGVSLPDPSAFLSIMISPSRGLFFIMPVFLYSLIGFISLWKKNDFRREAVLILTVVVGYFCINAGFYGWHGGWTFGPRYLVPMLPFLALPMILANLGSFWFYLLFGLSMFQVYLSVIGIPHVPPQILNPLVEFILPYLGYGYMAVNLGHILGLQNLWSIIPYFVIVAGLAVFIFRKVDRRVSSNDISNKWKTAIGLWIGFILIMLATVHTTPSKRVHLLRSKILRHAADTIHSDRLYKISIYEKRLAENKIK